MAKQNTNRHKRKHKKTAFMLLVPKYFRIKPVLVNKIRLIGQNNMFLKLVISHNHNNNRSIKLQDKKSTLMFYFFNSSASSEIYFEASHYSDAL